MVRLPSLCCFFNMTAAQVAVALSTNWHQPKILGSTWHTWLKQYCELVEHEIMVLYCTCIILIFCLIRFILPFPAWPGTCCCLTTLHSVRAQTFLPGRETQDKTSPPTRQVQKCGHLHIRSPAHQWSVNLFKLIPLLTIAHPSSKSLPSSIYRNLQGNSSARGSRRFGPTTRSSST